VIRWNYKGALHFYTGSGKGGRLIQQDYIEILTGVVPKDWQEDWILVEDNDGPHGTKGEGFNPVRKAKERLRIK
jgi:hypothetical protein